MLIDWVTVSAQIVNFLILVYLLKRFLYGPIIRAMNEREERIEREMNEARQTREKAEQKARELEKEKREIQESKDDLYDQARKEVQSWKEEAMDKARSEVDKSRNTWMEGLRDEKEETSEKIRERIITKIVDVSRKALRDLADRKLESQVAEAFFQRLEKAREKGHGEDFKVEGDVFLTIGMDLDEEEKEKLKQRTETLFSGNGRVVLEKKDRLGFGLQLVAGDMKWDWNLTGYMQDLERHLFAGLRMQTGEHHE